MIVDKVDNVTLYYLWDDPFFSPFLRELQFKEMNKWKEVREVVIEVDNYQDWILEDGNVLFETSEKLKIREKTIKEAIIVAREVANLEQSVDVVIRINCVRPEFFKDVFIST